ncbi:MAG TPA: CPBP family intramembrane metalloprotease [Methanofollis liminatans]|uniref:CPBP family intramembrane metalloprotease n=1 Tax=Methanofollis liminatans TaxID=2201 RepID=A0A831LFX6_9EURY|nr:CPBP family intramembrane metalloprotease [Methanofollis liminatans]
MDRNAFHPYLIALVLLGGALALVAAFSGDPQGDVALFFSTGAQVAPIFVIALLAFLALDRPRLRPVVAALTVLFVLSLALISWFFSLAPWLSLMDVEEPPLDLVVALASSLLLCLGAAGVSLLGFSGRVRIRLARYLPIDPENFVHTVALVIVAALALLPLVPLMGLGHPPLFDLIGNPAFALGPLSPAEAAKSDAYGLFWTVIGAFIAVGLFVKRSFTGALQRLGVVRPTLRSIAFAFAAGVVLVLLFSLVDHVIGAIWGYFGWYVTDEGYMRALFGSYLTPLAAVVAAIVAGVGEELAIRGVLQPRFGILPSVLVFASLHAYQYAWDGVFSVFLAGLVFALLRERTNTSVCAITHATYDLVLFALLMAGIGWV